MNATVSINWMIAMAISTLAGVAPAAAAAAPAGATLRLPAVFGDHMVLQSGQPVPIWGWAPPHAPVRVCFADQCQTTVANAVGRWRVELAPLAPSAAASALVIEGAADQRLRLQDVLVGEVWLCSGQSNMALPVPETEGGAQAAADARAPLIRLLRVPERVAMEPQTDTEAAWTPATPASLASFSAVGYYFAQELQRRSDTPVGVVQAAYGGAVCEAFLSPQTLQQPCWAPLRSTWDRFVAEYPPTEQGRAQVAETRRQQLLAAGKVPPPWPLDPKPPDHFDRPGVLYNGMIAPLAPMAMAGVLWYQGEANGWRGHQYSQLLPALIADWRAQWGRADLPFLFVQLPGFAADWLEPDIWPELREAQLLTWQRVARTAMVESIDVGDAQDLHPRRKREIGQRLALAALATAYGRAVEFSGPVFRRLRMDGPCLRLTFDHAAGGLVCPDGEIAGFQVAGADRQFRPASARLEADTLVVWSTDVPVPVAARYGWTNAPVASLFNGAGLPASPFRTDAWPGITDDRVDPEPF